MERPDHHALIFAPSGRDAAVAIALLKEAGIEANACPAFGALIQALNSRVTFVVITEEAIRDVDLAPLSDWIGGQAKWSDMPFIVLTYRNGGPDRNPSAARLSDILGNVTFLERPFHPTSFVSVARTALRGRSRQYEARTHIEEIEEAENRLQTALLAGRLGSWELDLGSNELVSSAVCKAIFGRKPEEDLSYDAFLASIHSQDRARVQKVIAAAISAGSDCWLEYRIVWPGGSIHWVELRARLIHDRAGRPIRLVGVSSDITDRKSYETELRRLNETLENRVSERTNELQKAHETLLEQVTQRERAEEQLRQSQKLEAIGQLTGGVAHDFNNLLMAVLGNLDLLHKHLANDPKSLRLIDIALQGARRGAALTQRLLAFARRQDLKLEPIDLSGLVEGMADLLRRSVGAMISVKFSIPEGLPLTMADGNQLELALLNLAVNARDAMPDGGEIEVGIFLKTTEQADDLQQGSYLCLYLRDTGIGMDEATLKKAIEPFYSTKELGKGTGLGLSMIHGLAVQLGGALRLHSKPGDGTTAELWLPTTELKVEAMVQEIPQQNPTIGKRSKILVVDDDALISMSTVDMLEDLGHEVVEANSGSEALTILSSNSDIDLMITDFSMPKMTGAQLAKAALEIRPGLPILLATGYADLPAGAEIDLPRLGKPYSQEELAQRVATALSPAREL